MAETPELTYRCPEDAAGFEEGFALGEGRSYALRIALTGSNHGPELHELIAILGRERVEYRLNRTLKLAGVEG